MPPFTYTAFSGPEENAGCPASHKQKPAFLTVLHVGSTTHKFHQIPICPLLFASIRPRHNIGNVERRPRLASASVQWAITLDFKVINILVIATGSFGPDCTFSAPTLEANQGSKEEPTSIDLSCGSEIA